MLARQQSRTSDSGIVHTPVLAEEVIRFLDLKPGEHCVDVTVGGGGHAKVLLARTAPDGRLLAIDLDQHALDTASRSLASDATRITLIHDSFDHLTTILNDAHFPRPDCILADCGISSLELADQSRGFSFKITNSPLDMRFDASGTGPTAADLLNTADEAELERIIREYGEERNARRIAHAVIAARRNRPFVTAGDLVQTVMSVHHGPYQRVHPATRTFQALRIAVNDELGRLQRFLPQAVDALAPGGRLAVISFHSLEDRIVKRFFRERASAGDVGILTKHPVTPGSAEVTTNPRSRSAKLRVTVRKN